jgi:hypothetical protein
VLGEDGESRFFVECWYHTQTDTYLARLVDDDPKCEDEILLERRLRAINQ